MIDFFANFVTITKILNAFYYTRKYVSSQKVLECLASVKELLLVIHFQLDEAVKLLENDIAYLADIFMNEANKKF